MQYLSIWQTTKLMMRTYLTLLRNPRKHISFVNLSIYYFLRTKIIRNIYNHDYFTVIGPTLEEEFELQYGSYSVIDIRNVLMFL